jgi:hypothetical protein
MNIQQIITLRGMHPEFLSMTEVLDFKKSLRKKCSLLSARKALFETFA